MPLPQIPEGDYTREEMIKYYIQAGWYKKLEFEWVIVDQRNRQVKIQTYRFIADTIPCSKGDCAQYMLTFVQLAPTGVIWTCGNPDCRMTQGPLAFELGQLINSRVANLPSEINKVLQSSGQKPPLGLEKFLPRGRKVRIT